MATIWNTASVSAILSEVVRSTGLADSGATQTRMYAAITSAGIAACDYRDWWFLRASDTFDTVDGTASYDLTSVGGGSMSDIKSIQQVWWDTDSTNRIRLKLLDYEQYLLISNQETTDSTTRTYTPIGLNTILLHPGPNVAKEVTVHYTKRHPKIVASADADLLIPLDYHYPIYVEGATWLLQHETTDPAALKNSPAFQSALQDIAMHAMDEQDSSNSANYFYPSQGSVPDPRGLTDMSEWSL